jgi:hypothetical protein
MASHNAEATPCIALRFEEEINLPDDLGTRVLDKKSVANFFQRELNIKVTDFMLPSIQMSTVIGLADLTEDEIVTAPIPMNVDLETSRLILLRIDHR